MDKTAGIEIYNSSGGTMLQVGTHVFKQLGTFDIYPMQTYTEKWPYSTGHRWGGEFTDAGLEGKNIAIYCLSISQFTDAGNGNLGSAATEGDALQDSLPYRLWRSGNTINWRYSNDLIAGDIRTSLYIYKIRVIYGWVS